jgi:hypothetical protein
VGIFCGDVVLVRLDRVYSIVFGIRFRSFSRELVLKFGVWRISRAQVWQIWIHYMLIRLFWYAWVELLVKLRDLEILIVSSLTLGTFLRSDVIEGLNWRCTYIILLIESLLVKCILLRQRCNRGRSTKIRDGLLL